MKGWLVDSFHLARGGITMAIHRNPPKHYLGYVVEGKVPVILIPGILGKWGIMKYLGDRISLEGHPVYIVPRLGHNLYSIPASAQKLKAIVRRIFRNPEQPPHDVSLGAHHVRKFIEEQNIKGAVIVAHSKGGLIGKYFLEHDNYDHRVIGMIAVATPFSGSTMAKLIPHKAFEELKTDSKIIHDLLEHTEINKKIVSIFPEYDNYVRADRGSFLKGAKNIEVPIRGHHTILFDKEVVEMVLQSIAKMTNAIR